MKTAIICLAALVIGVAASAAGYLISKALLKKSSSAIGAMSIIRQAINIGCLIAVYFASSALRINIIYPLLCAGVGITFPMFFFTLKLIKGEEKGEKEE